MPHDIESLRKDFSILAHNYQRPEVQDVADLVADSLELSVYARDTEKKYIMFAGVSFMAEVASILSGKKIFMPDMESHCPMAFMATREAVLRARKRHPRAKVVMYINTAALTKTVADIICTSANATKIVEAMDSEEIIFVPDSNLASYVSRFTSKKIIPVPENGHCAVHSLLTIGEIRVARESHPQSEVMVHPECKPEVIDAADHALGTGGMVRRAKESGAQTFIVGTEVGLLHRLKKENPQKDFIPASPYLVCPSMKMHTLEKIEHQMKMKSNIVRVPPRVAERARVPLKAMLEI